MKKNSSHADTVSNPNGLNSWDSLNRANRIKDLARIVDGNRAVLERLQNTSSNYDHNKHLDSFAKSRKLSQNLSNNQNNYSKNTYFLHSVCTKD